MPTPQLTPPSERKRGRLQRPPQVRQSAASRRGVEHRRQQHSILTNAAADAQGRISYRMAVVNNGLVTKTFQKSAFLSDDY
jgi:hypothetical protein